MDNKDLNNQKTNTVNSDEFVFIREEIKSRPINKKQLAKNTGAVILSAIAFGVVACLTFFLLSPFLTKWINKDNTVKVEEITPVVFPEETIEEEMLPEDMLITPEVPEIDYELISSLEEQQIMDIISSVTFSVGDYQNLYESLAKIANVVETSIVKVTSIKNDKNWFNELYEGKTDTSGLIVAEGNGYLYIVTYYNEIFNAGSIIVTFTNGIQSKAELINLDSETGLCVIGVLLQDINDVTKNAISIAKFGNSYASTLTGQPIIAVGSPLGNYGSLDYGMITGYNSKITVIDNNYRKLTTNIYGSKNATGIVINLKGEVLGIISNKFSTKDTENLINAIGINELKRTVEDMINNRERAYVGITTADVPSEAVLLDNAPRGAYILSVVLDSPAMNVGLQSGDIIGQFGEKTISTSSELVAAFRNQIPGSNVPVMVYRKAQDEYKELYFTVTLGTK